MSLEMKLDHQISQSVKKKLLFVMGALGSVGVACGPPIDAETLLACFLTVLDSISCKIQSEDCYRVSRGPHQLASAT